MSRIIHRVAWWFNLSALANILWTVTFSYLKLPMSTILIFILLGSLIMIMINLSKLGLKLNLVITLAFGLYSGW